MGTPPKARELRPLGGSQRHEGRRGGSSRYRRGAGIGRGRRRSTMGRAGGQAAAHPGPPCRTPLSKFPAPQALEAPGSGRRTRTFQPGCPRLRAPLQAGRKEGGTGSVSPRTRPSPNRQRRARTQLTATHCSPGAVPTAPTQPPAGRAPRARQHKRPRAGPCSLLSRSGNSNSFKMSGSVGASERAARRARAGLRTSRKAARTARAGAALLWLRGRRSRAGSSSPGTPQGSRELKSEKKKKQISSNLL